MAEEYVSKDQHRADMAELRSELKEEIAGLRQDMTAMRGELKEEIAGLRLEMMTLAKTMETTQQTMLLRFEQVDRQLEQVDRQFGRHDARLVSLENWMRAIFVTVALVAVGVAAQLFYTPLRFGLQPSTP